MPTQPSSDNENWPNIYIDSPTLTGAERTARAVDPGMASYISYSTPPRGLRDGFVINEIGQIADTPPVPPPISSKIEIERKIIEGATKWTAQAKSGVWHKKPEQLITELLRLNQESSTLSEIILGNPSATALECIRHYVSVCVWTCQECKVLTADSRGVAVTTADRHTYTVCQACAAKDTTCKECPSCNNYRVLALFEPVPEDMRDILHDNGDCVLCMERNIERVSRIEMRNYQRGVISSHDSGTVIKSPRTWGVELELVLPSKGKTKLGRAMATPALRPWGIGTDGSLNTGELDNISIAGTYELRSPPFAGATGETTFQTACTSIAKAGARVNSSCGTHIHLQLRGAPTHEKLKRIFAFYYYFDDVIQSFLPGSRRGNRFCIPMHTCSPDMVTRMFAARNFSEVSMAWYQQNSHDRAEYCRQQAKHGSRYFGANFHLLLHRNILEIRYHSGTLNPHKVLEWVNLHSRIMDFAEGKLDGKNRVPSIEKIAEMAMGKLAEKTEKLLTLLKLTDDSKAYWYMRQTKFSNVKVSREAEMLLPIEKNGDWNTLPPIINLEVNETCAV